MANFSELGNDYVRGAAPVFAQADTASDATDATDSRANARQIVSNLLAAIPSQRNRLIFEEWIGLRGAGGSYVQMGRRYALSAGRVRDIVVQALYRVTNAAHKASRDPDLKLPDNGAVLTALLDSRRADRRRTRRAEGVRRDG